MGDITSALALACEFRKYGDEVFFIINNNNSVCQLLIDNNFYFKCVEQLDEIENILKTYYNLIILIQLNTPIDEGLIYRKYTNILVTIDDVGPTALLANIRINPLYPINNSLSDFQYISLSPIYQKKHKCKRIIKKHISNILVTQGGSDTYGFTPKIVKSLYPITRNIKLNIILGPNFRNENQLIEALRTSQQSFQLIKGTKDLSQYILDADIAITAGGNTLFECACLGTPAIVVCGERFEIGTSKRLEQLGFGIHLGFGDDVEKEKIYCAVSSVINNYELRLKMSRIGKKIIDGLGIERIRKKIHDYSKNDTTQKN